MELHNDSETVRLRLLIKGLIVHLRLWILYNAHNQLHFILQVVLAKNLEITKRTFGDREKLPPAQLLSTPHEGCFKLSLSLLIAKRQAGKLGILFFIVFS